MIGVARREVLEESDTMENPRGILRPGAVGELFSLDRPLPPPDLSGVIDHHWIVRWDLRGRPSHRSEVITHPAVHVVFEPTGAFVYGVRRRRDTRIIAGAGWAVGTKFLPGGFTGLAGRPLADLTDSVLPLGDVFGPAGLALEAAAAQQDDPAAKLALLNDHLRSRCLTAEPDVTLVREVVAAMRTATPGTTVDDLAAAHHVSTRTLQRLFRRHVGVGPKWVLQRYRLHEALEQLEDRAGADWTRLALDLGYFDHAHFIRDFRAVTGRTPATYEREARSVRRQADAIPEAG
ncbi:transcriptional regulator [Paraconexibacter sp. AEG42_29]|uniref:Transcriptional regulator n=1 Tax=Paraconexibacter sp. AEG42_29 TaxID=2997339 RepID=A0AAU7AUC1_9ACTN